MKRKKHSSSNTIRNSSGAQIKIDFLILILFFFVLFSINVYSIDIAVCTDMNVKGASYKLTADIDNSAVTCMEITNHDITFDCDGHYIDGQNSGYGIQISNLMENITILNCEIREFDRSLHSSSNANVIVENFTSINDDYYGIYIQNLKETTSFTNVFVNNSRYYGVYLTGFNSNSLTSFYNLTILNARSTGSTYAGFYLTGGSASSMLNITGFNISNNANFGFYVFQTNQVIDFNDGYFINNSNYGINSVNANVLPAFYLDNVTIFYNGYDGIRLRYTAGGEIKNCNISYNDRYGIEIQDTDNYNFTNNTIKYNFERDISVLSGSDNNDFWNNNFEVNLMIEDNVGTNNWNLTTGNTWDNFDSDDEGCINDSSDHCTLNYSMAGSGGAKDERPIYTGVNGTIQTIDCNSCQNCSALITNWTAQFGDTLNLTAAINNHNGNCIEFQGHNGLTFDGNHYLIDGQNTGAGLYIYTSTGTVGADWTTILNINISQFDFGLYSHYGFNLTVENFTSNDLDNTGIYLQYLDTSSFTNIWINNSDDYGIYFVSHQSNSETTFYNLSILETQGTVDTYSGFYYTPNSNTILNISLFNISKGKGWGFFNSAGASNNKVYMKDGYITNHNKDGFYTGLTTNPTFYLDNVSILSNGLSGSYHGISWYGTSGGYVKNCVFSFNGIYGIYLYDSVDNYNFTNNTIKYNLDRDIHIRSSTSNNNRFWDNNFEVNLMVEDLSSDNLWNSSTKGNLWDNYDSDDEGCINDTFDHCTIAYNISGSGGGVDHLPIYTGVNGTIQTIDCNSCQNCSALITNWTAQFGDTLNLTAAINNHNGNCIEFQGHNGLTFDGNHYLIDGQNTGAGLYIYTSASIIGADWTTILNINISQFDFGLHSYYGFNLTVENFTSNDLDNTGIYLQYLDTSSFTNIWINNSNNYGINFQNHQSNSETTFYNLTIVETQGAASTYSGIYYTSAAASSILNITLFNISNGKRFGLITNGGQSKTYLKDGYITNNNMEGIYTGYNSFSPIFYINNVRILKNGQGGAYNGIFMYGSSGGYIKNSVIWNNTKHGIEFNSLVDNYNITNNNITGNARNDTRIGNANCDNNRFWNNTFNINTSMYDAGTGTEWNVSSGGNNWTSFNEPSEGCNDFNGDGICDDANVTIDADSVDELPLYNGPVFGCGFNITADITLSSDFSCNGTGFFIVVDNINFDCAGHSITADGAGVIGLKINSSHVNITNCYVYNFSQNIFVDPGVGVIIENNSLGNSSNCTVLNAYNSSIIRNNSYYNCTENAIILVNESFHNLIYNNIFNLSGTGVNIINGSLNNTVYNNSFYNSLHAHANSIAGNHFNNSKTGNYWDDILTLDIWDTDADNLGDYGLEYPYNNTNNANVTGKVNDYKPINPNVFGCGVNLTTSFLMPVNLTCNNQTAVYLKANNIVLDCAGHYIIGNRTSIGIYIEADHTVTTNCKITNWTTAVVSTNQTNHTTLDNDTIYLNQNGISFQGGYHNISNCNFSHNRGSGTAVTLLREVIGVVCTENNDPCLVDGDCCSGFCLPGPFICADPPASHSIIEHTYFYNNTIGVKIHNEDNETIVNNTFVLNDYGVYINSSVDCNVTNNTFRNNNISVYIFNGTNNFIWNNSFYNSTGYHAYADTNANDFNLTQGNYWDDILTLQIFDTDADGLGDAGSEWPYNNTNNANVTGLVNDYRPFTTKTTRIFINLTSPANGTTQSDAFVNFTYFLNTSIPANCTLFLNGALTDVESNLSTGTHNFSQTLAPGSYQWNVTCNDTLGTFNTSQTWDLTITAPPAEGGQGGGGGGVRWVEYAEVPKAAETERPEFFGTEELFKKIRNDVESMEEIEEEIKEEKEFVQEIKEEESKKSPFNIKTFLLSIVIFSMITTLVFKVNNEIKKRRKVHHLFKQVTKIKKKLRVGKKLK